MCLHDSGVSKRGVRAAIRVEPCNDKNGTSIGIRVGDASHHLAVRLNDQTDNLRSTQSAARKIDCHFPAGAEAGVKCAIAIEAHHAGGKADLSSGKNLAVTLYGDNIAERSHVVELARAICKYAASAEGWIQLAGLRGCGCEEQVRSLWCKQVISGMANNVLQVVVRRVASCGVVKFCSCITDGDLPGPEQQRNKKNKQASAVSPLPRRARAH